MDLNTQLRIADNMKYLRNVFGYTQEQIADKLHISKYAYLSFEQAKKIPGADVIIDLAAIYKVRTDTLLQVDKMKFINAVIFSDRGQNRAIRLVDIYNQLSPYSQGCLFERAEVLLNEEEWNSLPNTVPYPLHD